MDFSHETSLREIPFSDGPLFQDVPFRACRYFLIVHLLVGANFLDSLVPSRMPMCFSHVTLVGWSCRDSNETLPCVLIPANDCHAEVFPVTVVHSSHCQSCLYLAMNQASVSLAARRA